MPPKRPSQLPVLPPFGRTLLEREGALLLDNLNLLLSGQRGRSYTEFDYAGSIAVQEYGTLTLASDAISLVQGSDGQNLASVGNVNVDTEAAAATDDLVTITGGRDGMILLLRLNNAARVVTVRSTGNIRVAVDHALSTIRFLPLLYVSSLALWVSLNQVVDTLDELSDVTITTVVNNQVIVYNSTTGQWENVSVVSILTEIGLLYETAINEDLSNMCNGVRTVFELANEFAAESTGVYLNGLRQRLGAGFDYTETGLNTELTMAAAPIAGDKFLVDSVIA